MDSSDTRTLYMVERLMTTSITSGHLASNMGIRGHSAGDIYPFRVMGQGKPDDIKWFVVKPNGEQLGDGHNTTASAYKVARFAHAVWGS